MCSSDLPEADEPGPPAKVAGRIVLKRDQGRVVFLQLRDWTGQIQIFIGKKQVGEAGWALAEAVTLHDLSVARPSLEDTYLELTGHSQHEPVPEPAVRGRGRRR